jgi:hypothetical protein
MQSLKTPLIVTIAVCILVLSVAIYHSCRSGHNLDIDPHARKEIDKAMHK